MDIVAVSDKISGSDEASHSNIYFYREFRPEHAWIFNLDDYSKQLHEINSDEFAQKQFWMLCSLPNNKILCFCQLNKRDSGSWFSLDSKGNVFRFKKPSNKEATRPAAVYYKNDIVYIFGFRKWYKLDTYRNIFFSIAGGNNNLYLSCTLFNDYIILSCDQSSHNFEIYDILTNSISRMNGIEIGGSKSLFTLNETLYAIDCDGYLFSFCLWNLDEWKFMGVIQSWGIDRFSYWLYHNNDYYFMTRSIEIVKFSMKSSNLEVEISKVWPEIKKNIKGLNVSVLYENIFSSILESWKELFNPAISESLKLLWNLIVINKLDPWVFPFILKNNKKKYQFLKLYSNLDYIFDMFWKKDPRKIKTIILLSKPKKKSYDSQLLAVRIKSLPDHLDAKNWKKLKKNTVVLSPLIVTKYISETQSKRLNEFTIEMAKILSSILDRAVFILWGKEARSWAKFIDQSKHLLIENTNFLSTNEVKIKMFWDSNQFELAYSYLYK